MSMVEKMVEEAHQDQELLGCQDQTQFIKGKRTKRQRPQSPLTLAMVSSSCSAVESGGGGELGERLSDNDNSGDGFDHHHHHYLHGMQGATASPTGSVDFATSTEEEEDMANCLILLAQGQNNQKLSAELQQPANIPTASKGAAAAGLYVYECKTCNRCFPSFQALGGHRASHKKPKPNNNDERKGLVFVEEDKNFHYSNMSTTLSLQVANRALYASTNNKFNKVHECSICDAKFSSGQALGGHMRRHRAFTSTNTTAAATTTKTALSMATSNSLDQSPEAKKPRNLLQLDLNLPAPEDDRRESKFGFSSKEQVIVFSASSLVDCHY